MADDGSAQSTAVWPLPKFYFQVKWDSQDMSHLVTVRAGDTLPLLCKRIYSDPAYYMEVARVNRLVNFRNVLRFPPLS